MGKSKLRKVLILFCGGTISMHKDLKTGALNVSHGMNQFFEIEPRMKSLADIHFKFIANIDSTDADRHLWESLVDAIEKEYINYDAFLISMGTNTLAYCSSAISFALTNVGKPVVLTGAQIPIEAISTDGRNNLINALRICNMDLGGVFVVFGSKIILGCRAKKVSESDLDAFKTFNDSDFGEIGVGIILNKDSNKAHNEPLIAKNGFYDNIVCFTMIPGLDPNIIVELINRGVKSFVLRGYGTGDIPQNFIPALEYAREKKVPVVVTTQCPGGATALGINELGLKALKAGVIQVFDMSMESMTTKLMWLLHQNISYEKIKGLMQTNLKGEINPSKARIIASKAMDLEMIQVDK